MLFLDVSEKEVNNAERLQEMIDNKKNVFVLIHMIGCTPCKNTLPEWNKLKDYKELKEYEDDDDIIIANVEQSMCKKMHHKDLENIMSFPTIKHIQHNNVHDYNDERNTSAFSKWIKSLIKKDGKLKDINTIVIKDQQKINHGNIDMLIRPEPIKIKPKTKKNKKVRTKSKSKSLRKINKSSKTKIKTNSNLIRKSSRTKTKISPIRRKSSSTKSNSSKKRRKSSRTRTGKHKYNISKARRTFQSPLSYTKSLPV